MKFFEPLKFDANSCLRELRALRKWLEHRPQLSEKKHILPFFRKRRMLSSFIGSYNPDVIRFDRLAFEFSLFGDFTCDLVVGDSAKNAYSFVEFEDAGPTSLFVKQGRKATREWSPRFDHGYSQIIDWFYKLDDMRKTDAFVACFGAHLISCTGILVVGRERYLQAGEQHRLEWRRNNVVVGSRNIQCVTFDGLLVDLQARLETILVSTKTTD